MAIVKMFNENAVIPIEVGPAFVRRIQKILIHITSEHTQEEIDSLYEMIRKGEQSFPEEWMDHFFTLSVLITNIEEVAIKNNLTYDTVVPDEPTPTTPADN